MVKKHTQAKKAHVQKELSRSERHGEHKFATMSGGIFVIYMVMVAGVFSLFAIINKGAAMSGTIVYVLELALSAIVSYSFMAFLFGHGKEYRPSFMLSMAALVFLAIGVYVITLAFLHSVRVPYKELVSFVIAAVILVLFAYPVGVKSKLKWP